MAEKTKGVGKRVNPGSNPSSDPDSDPGSNPGSDPSLNPGSDPGFTVSLSPQIQLSQYDQCQTQRLKEFKECSPFQIYQSALGFPRRI